jgi:hypothetical protein
MDETEKYRSIASIHLYESDVRPIKELLSIIENTPDIENMYYSIDFYWFDNTSFDFHLVIKEKIL